MSLTTESALRKDRNTGKATMEHRHFATIAAIIRGVDISAAGLIDDADLSSKLAHHFADELRSTNPRFDRARFLRACGVEG